MPEAEGHWLAVERAAAAGGNADEALTALVMELAGPTTEECLERAAATGHAEAEAVLKTVAGFLASGARPLPGGFTADGPLLTTLCRQGRVAE